MKRYIVFVPSSIPGEKRADSLLCKDGHLRRFACFGTYRSCVRIYRRVHAAKLAACLTTNAWVAELPGDGYCLEASGLVIRTQPAADKPGYVTHTHHSLTEFALDYPKQP